MTKRKRTGKERGGKCVSPEIVKPLSKAKIHTTTAIEPAAPSRINSGGETFPVLPAPGSRIPLEPVPAHSVQHVTATALAPLRYCARKPVTKMHFCTCVPGQIVSILFVS